VTNRGNQQECSRLQLRPAIAPTDLGDSPRIFCYRPCEWIGIPCGHLCFRVVVALLEIGVGRGIRGSIGRSGLAVFSSAFSRVLALQAGTPHDELVCSHSVAGGKEDLLGFSFELERDYVEQQRRVTEVVPSGCQ